VKLCLYDMPSMQINIRNTVGLNEAMLLLAMRYRPHGKFNRRASPNIVFAVYELILMKRSFSMVFMKLIVELPKNLDHLIHPTLQATQPRHNTISFMMTSVSPQANIMPTRSCLLV